MKKFLCSILCAVMLLSMLPTAFAADTSGLTAFTEIRQYSDGAFADVPASAWYAPSVKTVYEKGIMDGTGDSRFDPQTPIPWAQAATIAVRLHAAYHAQDIPPADGPWYAQYLAYARENSLLPGLCPEDSAVASTPITREGLAVLFRSVLDEKDLPAINDQPIPDLDEIAEEYRDAVSDMFASGIFTGKDGLFDPDGQATRAEVATIIARLLCPGQRVSHDSRQNPYMADQMGNLYNGGLCARLGDTVYYMYEARLRDETGSVSSAWSIIGRTDDGQTQTVYDTDQQYLERLSVGSDGLLYFIERDQPHKRDILKQLDPQTGAAKDVYATPAASAATRIDFYLFYDNQLYISESQADSSYRIGRVSGGRLTTLAKVPAGWEGMYIDETMYCFGGKMYWLQSPPKDSKSSYRLMILDLGSGKISSVATAAKELACHGNTAWSLEYTNGNFPMILKRRSLAMPELEETVRVMDGDLQGHYTNLYANGSQLYYQVSGQKKLWTVSPTGQTEVAATARTPYFEASTATSQGIALQTVRTVRLTVYEEIDFILPDGQRISLPALLNKPYHLDGVNQLAATDNDASWNSNAEEGKTFPHILKRAYETEAGGVAVEVGFRNNSGKAVEIRYIQVKLGGAAEGTAVFRTFNALEVGESVDLTFVFPKGSVQITGSMEDLEIDTSVGIRNS